MKSINVDFKATNLTLNIETFKKYSIQVVEKILSQF